MIYRAVNPRQGYPTKATRAELLKSNHREVRDAAARMRPVVINGVKYLPVVSDQEPIGRSRVTSLPSFEVPRAESLAVARRAADSLRESRIPDSPSPVPQHIEELGSAEILLDSVVLAPRSQRLGSYFAVAALLWISAGIGFAWLALRNLDHPQIAAPHFDRRVGQ